MMSSCQPGTLSISQKDRNSLLSIYKPVGYSCLINLTTNQFFDYFLRTTCGSAPFCLQFSHLTFLTALLLLCP